MVAEALLFPSIIHRNKHMLHTDLLQHLEEHLRSPQKSERWAMYRLIVPVVDFANATLGMSDYFEFNQTSEHGSSQSVDIVLLENDKPSVMIEAKRVGRPISAEQIEKYLKPGVRGLVTNGIYWVLCLDGRNKLIAICREDSWTVIPEALDEVVSFIRGERFTHTEWSIEVEYANPMFRPKQIAKETSARRVSNPTTICRDTDSFTQELENLTDASDLDKVLLLSLVEQFDYHGGIPIHLRCEARASRVSFFDERIPNSSKRVARVELGKRQPDALVLTKLVNQSNTLQSLSSAVPHDKGPRMRRFRLSEESQAKAFGKALADLLNE